MTDNLGYLNSGLFISVLTILFNLAFFLALPVIISIFEKKKLSKVVVESSAE